MRGRGVLCFSERQRLLRMESEAQMSSKKFISMEGVQEVTQKNLMTTTNIKGAKRKKSPSASL